MQILFLYNAFKQPLQQKSSWLCKRKPQANDQSCGLFMEVCSSRETNGLYFYRERPVLNYIADFMCKELKLIIEVDGYTHTLDEVIKNDIIRQKNIEDAGFKVIRFKDEEVLKQITRVRTVILETIKELEKKRTAMLSLSSGEGVRRTGEDT